MGYGGPAPKSDVRPPASPPPPPKRGAIAESGARPTGTVYYSCRRLADRETNGEPRRSGFWSFVAGVLFGSM